MGRFKSFAISAVLPSDVEPTPSNKPITPSMMASSDKQPNPLKLSLTQLCPHKIVSKFLDTKYKP